MTYEEYNTFCQSLPSSTHVVQWGGSHVWKVGGKVYAIGGWQTSTSAAITFKVSDHNFDVLQEQIGFRPAPYLASRGLKWIQIYDTSVIDIEQLHYYITASYHMVIAGLSKKAQRDIKGLVTTKDSL